MTDRSALNDWVTRADALILHGEHPVSRCPFARWNPVDSHGGPMTSELGAVMHITTNHGDPQHFFSNAANQASSHFWIADDGSLEQMVDTALASWAQAGGNYQYVSVETSGVDGTAMNDAQVAMFGKLYAWGMTVHGWPAVLAEAPGQRGLGWHGMGGSAWGGHFDCPGDLRKAQRGAVLALAVGVPTASQGQIAQIGLPVEFPEDHMKAVPISIPYKDNEGWVPIPGGDGSKVVSVVVAEQSPPKAGYVPVPGFAGISTDGEQLVFGTGPFGPSSNGSYGAVVWLVQ